MRIIAGEHRGRRLAAPPGQGTRPMLDRVREALFGTLGPRVVDARVLDLCAGSGCLGIEALSRGAQHARFVEKSPLAAQVLERNVRDLGLEERAEILRADALFPSSWRSPEGEPAWADLVFFDPPYRWLRDERRPEVLDAVGALLATVLGADGVLCLHTPRGEIGADDFPASAGTRERRYGTSSLWYLWDEADARAGEEAAS